MNENFELRLLPCVRVDNVVNPNPLVGFERLKYFLPVIDKNGDVTDQVMSVSEEVYQSIVTKLTILSFDDFNRLQILEDEVLCCGVDGGESTSEAINCLEKVEKDLGVFRVGASCPRWQNYNESLNRLCAK